MKFDEKFFDKLMKFLKEFGLLSLIFLAIGVIWAIFASIVGIIAGVIFFLIKLVFFLIPIVGVLIGIAILAIYSYGFWNGWEKFENWGEDSIESEK
jgi:hypothetical protein